MVRVMSVKLDKWLDKNICDYTIVTNHFESIHSHEAVAIMTAGREMQ